MSKKKNGNLFLQNSYRRWSSKKKKRRKRREKTHKKKRGKHTKMCNWTKGSRLEGLLHYVVRVCSCVDYCCSPQCNKHTILRVSRESKLWRPRIASDAEDDEKKKEEDGWNHTENEWSTIERCEQTKLRVLKALKSSDYEGKVCLCACLCGSRWRRANGRLL